ncbi:hypothetical protein HNY73_011530 [Argiope bruennichi]|uniref:Uncharacterized protein n=1 Tax=Argiope bruennichi TaxID=94029 RepID=A0A8T0F4B0_ARGBR|nr:hypothetical protein HNY73_011530 [Argiope bruennichi]
MVVELAYPLLVVVPVEIAMDVNTDDACPKIRTKNGLGRVMCVKLLDKFYSEFLQKRTDMISQAICIFA